MHAKLIISNLGSKDGYGGVSIGQGAAGDGVADEVGQFLRSIGLENCGGELAAAGYMTVELLGEASMQDLLNAGLKVGEPLPITHHSPLIVYHLSLATYRLPLITFTFTRSTLASRSTSRLPR